MRTIEIHHTDTARACELVAEACALASSPPTPGPAGIRRIVHALQLRAELRSLVPLVDDDAVADDALGAAAELDAWLQHAEAAAASPASLSA